MNTCRVTIDWSIFLFLFEQVQLQILLESLVGPKVDNVFWDFVPMTLMR